MSNPATETLFVVVEREMEQSGFRPDQPQYYQGAQGGWQQFFAALEQVLARID